MCIFSGTFAACGREKIFEVTVMVLWHSTFIMVIWLWFDSQATFHFSYSQGMNTYRSQPWSTDRFAGIPRLG